MVDQAMIPVGAGILMTNGISEKGKTFEFGMAVMGRIAVHWVPTLPGTPWVETSLEVQAIGISRYRLYDLGEGHKLRYHLDYTVTKGWGFKFWDGTEDNYPSVTPKPDDYVLKYDSHEPTIIGVAQIGR